MRRFSSLFLIAGCSLLAAGWAADRKLPTEKAKTASAASALLLNIDGPIGPATGHYVAQGLERAQKEGHPVVILRIDTPGGLESSMRDIIKDILASPIPIVSFVAPNGARAASAGTYILYASHVAAMAPATNLGSATPVPIGGQPAPQPQKPGQPPKPDGADKDKEEKPTEPAPQPGDAMERKIINDSVAYIRSLAELRGRNADWAEKAVREGVNLQSSAALDQNVIDLIATDTADLLKKIDGRKVRFGQTDITLSTANLTVETHEADWRTQLLSVLTNPTVAYGLLLIGIYGLLFEGYNPGAILPGVAGAICLLLALFAFQILSVNFAGFALIVLGTLLFVAEAFVPSVGTLGIGGLISFVIGSIILFDKGVPGYSIAMPLIAAIAFVGALVLGGMVWMFGRARRRPVVTGVEHMIGGVAEVMSDFAQQGTVRFQGELWNAYTSAAVRAGQRVRISKVDGLQLWVDPV